MSEGIVIATCEGNKPFLDDLIKSLDTKYPIIIIGNNGYSDGVDVVNDWNGFEFGALIHGMERYDRFIFLPDSMLVKNNNVFKLMFDNEYYVSPNFFHYIGVFDSETLKKIEVPKIYTKEEAITGEHIWTTDYRKARPEAKLLEPSLPVISDKFEEKHGRLNMVVENDYFIKYKGTYR